MSEDKDRAGGYLTAKPTLRCLMTHFMLWTSENRFNSNEKWCPVCERLFFWRPKK